MARLRRSAKEPRQSQGRRTAMAGRWAQCRSCVSLMVVLLLLTLAGPATAQDEASIYGTVLDESRAVLPGVTVTIRSPALQTRERVALTDTNGEYRVAALPIG